MEFELILKKIQSTLDQEEEAQFQQWYEASEDHRAYFRRVEKEFQKEQSIEPQPKQAWEKIDQRLFAASRKRYWWSAVAALLILAFLAVSYFFEQGDFEMEPTIVEAPTQQMENEVLFIDQEGQQLILSRTQEVTGNYYSAGESGLQLTGKPTTKGKVSGADDPKINTLIVPRARQYSVELSDGTKVWINAESKISFPSDFVGHQIRRVNLEYGEAYFEVSPSQGHNGKKFVVLTQGQSVEVLGTKFNINAYPESDAQVTTLVEGSVIVSTPNHIQALRPGEQSLNQGPGKELMLQKVNPEQVISWKRGKFIFYNKTLEEIMQVLQRWYDVQVAFKEPQVREKLFNGVLNNEQELEEILEILESTNKASFELNGSSIEIWDSKKGNGA